MSNERTVQFLCHEELTGRLQAVKVSTQAAEQGSSVVSHAFTPSSVLNEFIY